MYIFIVSLIIIAAYLWRKTSRYRAYQRCKEAQRYLAAKEAKKKMYIRHIKALKQFLEYRTVDEQASDKGNKVIINVATSYTKAL